MSFCTKARCFLILFPLLEQRFQVAPLVDVTAAFRAGFGRDILSVGQDRDPDTFENDPDP
jgi:hypothetical protein